MICIGAALRATPLKGLLIRRNDERKLRDFVYTQTNYSPFVFNTRSGLFIFLPIEYCEDGLSYKIEQHLLGVAHRFVWKTSPSNFCFFRHKFKEILTSPDYSSLVWKNFISSFLSQLKPFRGEIGPIHGLFKDVVGILKLHGNEEQMFYYKKKMDTLRSRVELDIL